MGALQVATQYPLQSKAFTWPLSALHLLSRIPYSALHTLTGSVPVALFPAIVGNDKTIKLHYKTSNHMPCEPHGYWAPEHAFECSNRVKSTLSNLNIHYSNTHATATNDAVYENSFERRAA
jgi:hypothetical protein